MSEKGFSLLELVLVIAVLAVLAITASPGFFSLARDAEQASLRELAKALQSGTEYTFYQATIRHLESEQRACLTGKYDESIQDCSDNGILLHYGGPAVSFTNLSKLIHLNDWHYNQQGIPGNGIVLARTEQNLTRQCRVIYTAPSAGNGSPDIQIYTDEC